MQSDNSAGKGYSDEQWESLLSQTFGDVPPVPLEMETPAAPVPVPSAPISVKKQKSGKKLWVVIAALSAVFIVSLSAILLYRNAPTKEQKLCMEALQQWQSAEYYQLDTVVRHIGSKNYILDSVLTPVQYDLIHTGYYHGGENNLIWNYYQTGSIVHYAGKVQTGDAWFSYSSCDLDPEQWKSANNAIPFSTPWILNFSLNDVKILDQQHKVADGVFLYIFSVIDTDPSAAFYGQGPYYVQFYMQNDQLQSLGIYQTDTVNSTLVTTHYHLIPRTKDEVLKAIQSQLKYPQRMPGLLFSDVPPDKTQTDFQE